jgi:SNF2 family DNA or RNA helicase
MYDEMQRELFTWVDAHPLEAFSAGAKAQKCLQLASGSVILNSDESKWSAVHDEKIEALRSIVEETNGAPLLVAYQFRADLERILKAFPRAKSLDKNSDATIREFQDGKLSMLVVHPASAGHGLDLQHNCWTLVDYSSGFNLEYDEQVIERIGPTRQMQLGKDRVVFRYRIVARNTIEETVVLPRLKSKASVQDALKEAMKNR